MHAKGVETTSNQPIAITSHDEPNDVAPTQSVNVGSKILPQMPMLAKRMAAIWVSWTNISKMVVPLANMQFGLLKIQHAINDDRF